MGDWNSGDGLPVPPGWSVGERVRINDVIQEPSFLQLYFSTEICTPSNFLFMIPSRSAGVTTKPTLSVSMDESSNLDVIANDQQTPNPAFAGESMPMSTSEQFSSQCFTDEAARDKHLAESEETKHEAEKAQNGQRKNKHKKEISLPRRASKRLAGIKLDPVPELKTSNRVRRVAAKEAAVEREVITNANKSSNFSPTGTAKQFDAVVEGGSDTKRKFDSATNTMESGQCELHKKTVEEHGSDRDQECFSFWPLQNQGTFKEHARVLDSKLDYSLDLPLGELLTDPCIAFAIQTLTGITFESCENSQISYELKNIKQTEASDAAEGHNKEINLQNKGDEEEGCNVFSTLENLTIPKELASDADIDGKANEKSGSSSEMPIDISWMDPCIEFAIKTLTGNGGIPFGADPNSENCLQRQLSSSNTQGHCEMAK